MSDYPQVIYHPHHPDGTAAGSATSTVDDLLLQMQANTAAINALPSSDYTAQFATLQTSVDAILTELQTPSVYTPRAFLSSETIAITDAAVITLNPPADADIAELSFSDGAQPIPAAISATTAPDPANGVGHVVDSVELESAAEIGAFGAIAMPGHAGFTYVEYFQRNDGDNQ